MDRHDQDLLCCKMATVPARNPTKPELREPAQKRASPQILHYATPFPAVASPLPASLVSYIAGLLLTSTVKLQPKPLEAVYDPFSQAVWVQDARSVEFLWAQGFFGKGSLSRSEPTWWTRAQNKMGAGLQLTSEEVTAIRRAERKAAKIVKAKEKEEALLAVNTPTSEVLVEPEQATVVVERKPRPVYKPRSAGLPWDHPDNKEHLQLQPEEAFYLIYALGSVSLTLSDVSRTIFKPFTVSNVPALAPDSLDDTASVYTIPTTLSVLCRRNPQRSIKQHPTR